MRLLYVGLTRAKERLVIAGIAKDREVEDCWHRRVHNALVSLGAEPEADPQWGDVLRYRGSERPAAVRPKAARIAPEPLILPDWARTPAPPEARPPRPLAPSAAVEDQEPSLPPSEAMRAAARRGTLIHRLFERLPAVAPDQRRQAALRWLERSAGVASSAEREDIAALVCGILGDPAYAELFGPGSLAEAPIAAVLPDGTVVAGTVDRLLVTDERILIADFKTGQVPASDQQIPASHRAQMAAYAAALQVIFPRHAVLAVLLYTAAPKLFELPA
jgi:ATP-dependent helicase/nuclease subunit A